MRKITMDGFTNINNRIGTDTTMPVFVEYDGDNRCARCCFCYKEKFCKRANCTPEERSDGKRGYFRDGSPTNGRIYATNINFNVPY